MPWPAVYKGRESATVPAAVSPAKGFAGTKPLCNTGEGAANRDKSEDLPVNSALQPAVNRYRVSSFAASQKGKYKR